MRALALAALMLLAGGCLEISATDGAIECSNVPDRLCPHHWYCAWNNRCYRDGHAAPPMDMGGPDLQTPDFSTSDDDLSVPASFDLAMTPADLTSSD